MTGERRFTLQEAKRKQQCAEKGHDFDIPFTTRSLEPIFIICRRCGQEWGVQRGGS